MAEEEKNTQENQTEANTQAEEKTAEEATPLEEKKEEAPASEADSAEEEFDLSEASEEHKKLIEQVENMTVLELNTLVKLLEKRFGVSASAVAAAPGAGGDEAGGEEKSEFDVELTSAGEQKIQVIKAVKEVLGLGLKEAKDMVDGAPTVLKQGAKKDEAEALKSKVEEAGGQVTLS